MRPIFGTCSRIVQIEAYVNIQTIENQGILHLADINIKMNCRLLCIVITIIVQITRLHMIDIKRNVLQELIDKLVFLLHVRQIQYLLQNKFTQ